MFDTDNMTLPQLAKRLERYIVTLPANKQFNKLGTEQSKAMMALSDSAYGLKMNADKYFYANDSAEQQLFLTEVIEQSKLINDKILLASQYDLMDAVDVAHLSALAETIKERLQ